MEQTKCYVIDTRKMRKDGTIVKVAGLTFILFACLPDSTFASTGIDVGAQRMYTKLLNIAKWVLVFKGGIDTVKSVADGDLPAAKRNFLGYFVTYGILVLLPWGMNEVDRLFAEMGAAEK
ncbi:hypothetical protein [Paenibacillus naphthalenovorans]|uniref:hypothetical protein n=1 Tax=Paenibacillus naphthalenovorans TaxID=162209 RepID=UPI003D2D1A82